MDDNVGNGGFYYPKIFIQSKDYVTKSFKLGKIDHADFSFWTFADKFMAYLLSTKFLEFVDKSYPTPREKTEVPIWFLIACQIVMKMTVKNKYNYLDKLMLNAGPVLLKVGFNIGGKKLGFNDKNKNERDTAVHQDTVRKFFKDTDVKAIRDWYNQDVQEWFKYQKYFDAKGIYVLDQTHCVVPENENYKDAVRMPVDEHGQRYKDIEVMTSEQKRALKYHPCYALSSLLHLSHELNSFHIAGYEWGPGNEDELVQAEKIIKNFHEVNKTGTIKLLIMDRGYLSGKFITLMKEDYKINLLFPLRNNMEQYKEAILISKMKETKWEGYNETDEETGEIIRKYKACTIPEISMWEECKVKLYTTVIEKEYKQNNKWGNKTFVLASTKNFGSAISVLKTYALRTQIEERFKQLKVFWNLADFPSPHKSLIETQVCFTMLTYSLIQAYLLRNDLQKYANKTIQTMQGEEALGLNNVVTYVDGKYAIYDTKESWSIINNFETEEARRNLQSWIDRK